jgi:hypothetical protein
MGVNAQSLAIACPVLTRHSKITSLLHRLRGH